MIRDRRWKLIAYHVNGEKHIQLFDMEKDPHELENLAGQADKTETIDRLLDAMRDWQKKMGDPFDVAPANAAEAKPSPDFRQK